MAVGTEHKQTELMCRPCASGTPVPAGKPLFGTLISLLYDGAPVLGIIDQPITKVRLAMQ
jgi:hypothetical protein